MTIDEFLAVLREQASAGRWVRAPMELTYTRYGIRTDGDLGARHCPLTFVAAIPGLDTNDGPGLMLGLSGEAIEQIIGAADDEPAHDPALRQALLEAVGLAE